MEETIGGGGAGGLAGLLGGQWYGGYHLNSGDAGGKGQPEKEKVKKREQEILGDKVNNPVDKWSWEGFWDYFLNGGRKWEDPETGLKYYVDYDGIVKRRASTTGYPQDIGPGGKVKKSISFGRWFFGLFKGGGKKLLSRFNSVESLIEFAGKLKRGKGGVKIGEMAGNADDVFNGLAKQYGAKIRTSNTGEKFFSSGNVRVGLHNSSTGAGPTLHIKNGDKLYKIRIQE